MDMIKFLESRRMMDRNGNYGDGLEKKEDFTCSHCKMDIRIRNPSGYCDHLYYPDYCKTCKELHNNQQEGKNGK